MKASSARMMTAMVWMALGPWSLQAARAAGTQSCFEYEDACYTSAAEACGAVARARRADTHVDNPYGNVVGAKDAGDKFWCKLADKNGETDEQEYGSKRTVQAKPTPKPGGPTPEATKAQPDDCALDKLKGAKLRNQVIAVVRRYTAESNQKLIDNPKASAGSVPSVGKGFFTGDYGTLLENLVAQRVAADACLSKYLEHLTATEQSQPGPNGEKGDHPDFRGKEGLADLTIDITTAEAKARKLGSEGGKAKYVYIEYERGLCVDANTRMAVKIPKGADRTLIKNGNCPDRWK